MQGLHTVGPLGLHLSGPSAAFSAGRFLRNGAEGEGGKGKMPYSCHWQNTFPEGG